ncbi:MAG: hypothetical protein NT150_05125 [Bacteroidetes bacterium]|nr:hypothetical protein [Bacteroidota bacterium]
MLISLALLYFFGDDEEFFSKGMLQSWICAIPLIIIQYFFLNRKQDWLYKILVFYISMLVFLFIYGMLLSMTNIDYTIIDMLKGGFLLMVFGQIFGIPLTLLVAFINGGLQDKVFIK